MFCTLVLGGYITALAMADAPNAKCFDPEVQAIAFQASQERLMLTEELDLVEADAEARGRMAEAIKSSEYLQKKNEAASGGEVSAKAMLQKMKRDQ